MTDSTGTPLEGGIASYSIDLPKSDKSRPTGLVKTDASGKVRTVVDIGRCVGGNDADVFAEKDRWTHIWRTQYFEGSWVVDNPYGGADLFDFSSLQRSGGLDLSGGNSWVLE
ncbi:hypothetical protein NLO86_21620 [Pseudomonas savastanoi]|uniref:hypothetical protein n=1 Tax=Pseudomonas savastanoi TaxID=29438 RepID=UPI00210D937A|nr:hypothetical protein [Pseudomonas savastanoi]MCQ3012954.1 hypothetical protein [Pseudomonas savastanoi]